ncbi:MAG: MMPL family transporter [Planctomycetes bacterium]|nr:MMPL family transporter [Planctomycetota bacterium]
MRSRLQRVGELLVARRLPILAIFVVAFAACLVAVPNTHFDMSLTPLLRADEALAEEWGTEDVQLTPERDGAPGALLTLDWSRPVRVEDLAWLGELADHGLRILRGFDDAWVIDHRSGKPVPRRFLEIVGDRSLTEAAHDHPPIDGALVSEDGTAVALIVAETDRSRAAVVLDSIVPEHVTWRLISAGAANDARRDYMIADVQRTLTIEAILFGLLLPLLFRSVRSVVIPLGVVMIATAMSFGSLTLLGRSFTILDCAVPGLIVVIGLSDAVHMLHRFEEALGRGLERRRAVVDMIASVGWACILTSITTAIGFLSLIVSDHAAVREFGFKSAYAVMATLATTLTLIPIALSWWPAQRPAPPRVPGIGGFDYRYPRTILVVTALVVAWSSIGATRNHVDAQWLEELPPDDPIVTDLQWFDAHFRGFSRVEFTVQGAFDQPATVRALEALGGRIVASEPDVRFCETFVDWLREILGRPHGELDDNEIRSSIALLRLAGDRFPSHRISREFDRARFVLTTANLGMHRYFELGRLATRYSEGLSPRLEPHLSGDIRVAHESVRLIATTMLESFLISLISITLLIGILYRSARVALISIVPNALPVLLALGLTGWLGIPIRIGLVMLFSLGLGLAVDDSIHVLTRFGQERPYHSSARDALQKTLRSSGGALIITSLILGLGALCHLPSDLRSLQDVGVIVGAIVFSALIADLYLLPLLLEWFDPHPEQQLGPGPDATNPTDEPRRRTPEPT